MNEIIEVRDVRCEMLDPVGLIRFPDARNAFVEVKVEDSVPRGLQQQVPQFKAILDPCQTDRHKIGHLS